MKIKIGDIVLAGGIDVNESPYDVRIYNTRSIQIISAIRSETAHSIDRGNQQTIFEFSVTRKHNSTEDAQSFVLKHSASLNDLADYLIVTEEPSGNMFFLKNVAISEVFASYLNNTSTTKYKVIGGNFVTNI